MQVMPGAYNLSIHPWIYPQECSIQLEDIPPWMVEMQVMPGAYNLSIHNGYTLKNVPDNLRILSIHGYKKGHKSGLIKTICFVSVKRF
jgi:hypothetical protein